MEIKLDTWALTQSDPAYHC